MAAIRNLLGWAAAALLGAATLSCGGGSYGPATGGESLVVLIESYPGNFDPRIGTDQASAHFFHLVFEGLTRVGKDGGIEPLLAASWETPDDRTYVFHLRNDAVFHGGKPLEASDVVFTYRDMLRPEFVSAKKEPYEAIEAVEALDARTVRFRLKTPFAPFLNAAALGVVPGDGSFSQENPVGTGPFAFVSAKRDSHIVLRAHDRHSPPPAVKQVLLKIVPDSSAREFELRKGTAHLAVNNILPSALSALGRETNLRVVKAPGGSFAYLGFNMEDEILGRREVRQAIAHAINRRKMIEGILEGLGTEADTPLPPHLWAHEVDVPRYDYDPNKAKAYLDFAGFKPGADGIRFRLAYKTSNDSGARAKAVLAQEYLAAVGIAVDIRTFEFATFYDDILKGNFQMYSLMWTSVNDPDLLRYMFHSASIPPQGANRGRFRHPDVDALLDRARTALDNAERRAYYAEAQRIIAKELPYVPLWYATNFAVMSRNIAGFELWPSGEFYPLADVRFVSPEEAP